MRPLVFLFPALAALCMAEPPAARVPKDILPEKLALEAIPNGLDRARPQPPDGPLTEARVRLGRRLFFDPLLSADQTLACASCHDPAHGFAGSDPRAVGVQGRRGRRHAPSLLNRAYGSSFFWDGRETTLEAQALRPLEHPDELGTTVPEVVSRLRASAEYRRLFQDAFAELPTGDNLARALASFERVLLAGDSRVDRFRRGEVTALNESEKHGLWLFESRGGCWRCHSGSNFSDEKYHNTGVSWGKDPVDLGRYEISHQESDRGRFKTPTLRAAALSAPYMHDGSLATLEEVAEFYNKGGGKNPHLDPALAPLGLDREEMRSLASFLRALSEPAAQGRN